MAQPASVVITDVALRDGLQIQPRTVPTDTKLELYDRLRAAGVRSVEVGSFVSPRLVPQMADADELFRRLPPPADGEAIALVPNLRGAERALAAGVRHARLLISCTEGHSKANTNRSVDEGLAVLAAVRERLLAEGVHVTGAIATVFVCPFDGVRRLRQVDQVVGVAGPDGADRDQPLRHPRQGRSRARRAGGRRDAVGVPGRHVRPAPAQHVRHGAGQRRGGPRAGDPRSSTLRWAASAAAPSPRERQATSQRRTWSSCSTRWECRPASTWTGWPRPPGSCGRRSTGRWSPRSRGRWGGRHERTARTSPSATASSSPRPAWSAAACP